MRMEIIEPLIEGLGEHKTKALEIRESMPWVTEDEQNDLVEKIDETRDFIEEKMNDQEVNGSLSEDPLFTMDDVETKMKKLEILSKKIFGKKKPKEPKKKKEKVEEEKTDDSSEK